MGAVAAPRWNRPQHSSYVSAGPQGQEGLWSAAEPCCRRDCEVRRDMGAILLHLPDPFDCQDDEPREQDFPSAPVVDGRHGARPTPGARLDPRHRLGGGSAGGVGAEAVNHLVVQAGRERPPAAAVRDPLAATGGVEPEPVQQVSQLAPLDLRRTRLRAVTAEDCAALAAELPGVQRAAADIRRTGPTPTRRWWAAGPGGPGRPGSAVGAARCGAPRRRGRRRAARPRTG